MEKIRIFKVTGFEVDNIKSNRYFKIKFKFNIDGVDHIDKLEKRVINEYTCIYNNAGTQETCLILNENCNYIEPLQNKFDELSEEYIDNFYDKKHDAFLFFWNHANILYDPYLTKFISDNKLFEKDFSFHSLHIEEKIPPLRNFKKKYLESIFHSLEKRKKIDVYRRSFRTVRIYDLSSSFGSSAFMYCQVEVNSNDEYKCLYNIPYLDFHFIKEEDPIGETLKLRASYLFDEDIEEENIEDENKLNGKLTYKAKDKSYMNSSFNFEKEDESLINVISKLKADDESSINGRFNYEAEDNSLIPASTEFKYLAPLVYQKKVDPQIEVFKEIIREYFRNNSTKESSKLILQLLDEFTLEYRFDYMIYTPMILFILKSFINNITINKE